MTHPNEHILFGKQTYSANHLSVVPLSLLDGLKFIYQDYNNIEKYPTVMDYAENYLAELKDNYGIEGRYTFEVLDAVYLMDILINKKKEEYEYWAALINKHNLFFNKMGIDNINLANHYFVMGFYPETITYINKASEELETLDKKHYHWFLSRALKAYEQEGRLDEAIPFLEKSIAGLPEKYKIYASYKLAKVSLENRLSVKKGRRALEYCKANFRENNVFTMDDLLALQIGI